MSRLHALLLPALLALALVAPGIARDGFLHEDEWRNSVMVRESIADGPALHPRLHRVRYPDYPPLYFWLAHASARLEGEVTPFTVRFPAALGGVLCAVGAALLALRLEGSTRVALGAGCLTATLPGLVFEERRGMIDPLLAGLSVVAVALLASSGREGSEPLRRRAARFALGSVFLGLAWLAKGPLAAVLIGLALAGGEASVHLLGSGSREERRRLVVRGVLVLLVVLAVAAAWYGLAFQLGGEEFGRDLLYKQTIGRFAEQKQHAKWRFFYWRTFLLLLPAMAFAAAELVALARARSRLSAFALGWFLLVLVFLSISKTKRSYYPMPAYPAVALMAARLLARDAWRWLALGAIPWVLGVLGFAAFVTPLAGLYDQDVTSIGFGLSVSCALGVGAGYLLLRRRRPDLALAFALAFPCAGVCATIVPRLATLFGQRDLAVLLTSRGFARDRIAVSPGGNHREALCWELAASPVVGLENVLSKPGHELADPDAVIAWLRRFPPGDAVVICRPKDAVGRLDEALNPEIEKIAKSDNETEDFVALTLRRRRP